MSFNWCRTFQLIAAKHERRLHELKSRFPDRAEEMVEWAREKGNTTVHSFWDWLDESERRVSSGRELD